MKAITLVSIAALTASAAYGKGLYQASEELESSLPLRWSLGMDAIWDDNTTPGPAATDGDETFSLNPYAGITFASITPETTVALYARLGLVYYLDQPAAAGSDDIYGQSRIGLDINHNLSERLRLSSVNYLAYELEPDYSYGIGTNRQAGEYLYWATDNSLGFRWSERFGTVTGIKFDNLSYNDVANADRSTWTAYNQLRYQLSQQTVLTGSYRYAETSADGAASDATDQYLLIGAEQRVSANTLLVLNAGVQMHELDNAANSDSTNPYLELSMSTQVNQAWSYRTFVRYSAENYDSVVVVGGLPTEFASKLTLRVGASGNYKISPRLSLFGGVDLINSSFEEGAGGAAEQEETLVNAYIGSSLKLTDNVFGTLSYNFTNADSDIADRGYDRSRVSVGVRAEF